MDNVDNVNIILFRRSAVWSVGVYIVHTMMHAVRVDDGYIITITMHTALLDAVNNINGIKQGERTDLIDNVNKVGA